jgi:hypothetical protein
MLIGVLRGSSLELKLGLFFLLNLHPNHLQMTKSYPHSKEEKYTYSNQLTNLETVVCDFWGSFAILRQSCHNCAPSTWIYTLSTCPTKNSNGRCLGFACWSTMQVFRSIKNVTKVVVHGRGGAFFSHGQNHHLVID